MYIYMSYQRAYIYLKIKLKYCLEHDDIFLCFSVCPEVKNALKLSSDFAYISVRYIEQCIFIKDL